MKEKIRIRGVFERDRRARGFLEKNRGKGMGSFMERKLRKLGTSNRSLGIQNVTKKKGIEGGTLFEPLDRARSNSPQPYSM